MKLSHRTSIIAMLSTPLLIMGHIHCCLLHHNLLLCVSMHNCHILSKQWWISVYSTYTLLKLHFWRPMTRIYINISPINVLNLLLLTHSSPGIQWWFSFLSSSSSDHWLRRAAHTDTSDKALGLRILSPCHMYHPLRGHRSTDIVHPVLQLVHEVDNNIIVHWSSSGNQIFYGPIAS